MQAGAPPRLGGGGAVIPPICRGQSGAQCPRCRVFREKYMKDTIKVFIASSIVEFADVRDDIDNFLWRLRA